MNKASVIMHKYNDLEVPFLLNNICGILEESRENADRISSIYDGLKEIEGIEIEFIQNEENIEEVNRLISIIHEHEYINYIKNNSILLKKGEYIIEHPYHPDYVQNDTPILTNSYRQAYEAAVTAYQSARVLIEGQKYVYALCRPPGHHAGRNFMGGYCYINNAAISANTLLRNKYKKVGILDIDYHFGNGTEDIVSSNEHIIFVSIHASTKSNYPYIKTKERNENSLFLSFEKKPDELEYLQNVNKALNKLSNCEAIVVSLGYDIIKNDPHGKWDISHQIYKEIGKLLHSINIPICFVQEGGYDADNNRNCAVNLFEGILGKK